MAKEIVEYVYDDIDASKGRKTPDAKTYRLVDPESGALLEIDLADPNAAKLVKALEPFLGLARPVEAEPVAPAPRQRSTRSSSPAGDQRARANRSGADGKAAKVRVWAAKQGIKVSQRGKLPEAVLAQYDRAHPTTPATPAAPPAVASPFAATG